MKTFLAIILLAFTAHGQTMLLTRSSAFRIPAGIPGLVMWLKAEDVAGSDGDPISTWDDRTSSNNDATSSGTQRPVLRKTSNGFNNLNVLEFQAGDDRMATPITTAYTDFTAVAVYKDTGAVVAYERVLDKLYDVGFWMGRDNVTASRWGGGVLETLAPYGGYGTLTDGNAHVLIVQRSGTTRNVWGNGATLSSATVSGSALSSTNSLYIGYDQANGNSSSIKLAEVLMFNEAISTANRQALEDYLGVLYGITITH